MGVGGVGVGEAPGAIDFDLNETDEYIIQGTLIENKQSMKIWKVGEEEPTAPQVSWVDDGYTYDSGSVGLITYFGHNNPSGRHLSVSFDDVAFTAREPATILVQPSPEYLIRDTSSDGKGDDVLSGTPLFNVGELDSPSANYVGRSISKFALPNYPDLANRLKNATLRYYLTSISSEVPAGPLSVWHSQNDNDLDPLAADFEDASYLDTQEDLIQPTDAPRQYYEVDVTEWVRADLAERRSQSTQRISVAGG